MGLQECGACPTGADTERFLRVLVSSSSLRYISNSEWFLFSMVIEYL